MNVTYAELTACSAKRSVRRSSEQIIQGLMWDSNPTADALRAVKDFAQLYAEAAAWVQ